MPRSEGRAAAIERVLEELPTPTSAQRERLAALLPPVDPYTKALEATYQRPSSLDGAA